MTPELAPPLQTTPPLQWEDVCIMTDLTCISPSTCYSRAFGDGLVILNHGQMTPACHVFDPSKKTHCVEGQCTLNKSKLKHLPDGVMWKPGKDCTSSGVVLVT
ncbi:hypothetical protein TNCV_1546191 [Trichonephila clavipes]|nr:hypothetical protein TNCV_1546191 [Trichonephila clavipes]